MAGLLSIIYDVYFNPDFTSSQTIRMAHDADDDYEGRNTRVVVSKGRGFWKGISNADMVAGIQFTMDKISNIVGVEAIEIESATDVYHHVRIGLCHDIKFMVGNMRFSSYQESGSLLMIESMS